jgi:hydrogenase maturation protein HypF
VSRTLIRVTGTVQGVGFRPFVYRHAVALGLDGFVLNDSAGVLIDVEGDPSRIAELERLLVDQPPPLARVATVTARAAPPSGAARGFHIVASEPGGRPAVPVSVDSATCPSCLAEVDDPADRRHRYPFTNCTDCGPRYTIVLRVPYDRPATTMAGFTMCPRCQAEYDDPANRRFHAQPNACPECGPTLTWRVGATTATADAALTAAVEALQRGAVVAVKGIGGYHLAVDATDEAAVRELRRRKARDDKPFAVMVADVETAQALCVLSDEAVAAMTSPRRPIVLAPRRTHALLADGVAPGLPDLGLMLPYTPLHHLLLAEVGRPLVMTSGNLSDEPIAHDDDDARVRLGPLVDGLLTHDRAIHIRCDDSVVRALPQRLQVMRRSRGYAPEPLRLPFTGSRAVLAVGAELKSTISVAKGDLVVPSHHLGDLEHLATYQSFLQALDHLPALYGIAPDVIAHDLHPEYLSTKLALDLDRPTVAVQHHHAHVAACMVEHGRTAPVLGVAFDGLGYGPDGTLWGGELLVADFAGFTRVGHLRAVTMPGGVAAIREPWRMAAAWVAEAAGRGAVASCLPDADPTALAVVLDLVDLGRGPSTSSVGRLFDAVAVLLGGRRRVSYEAQAAIELEALARRVPRAEAPTFDGTVVVTRVDGLSVLDPALLVRRVLAEGARGTPAPLVAAGFHEALGRAAAAVAADLAHEHRLDAVALTGGAFQNARLTEVVEQALRDVGVTVLVHAVVPPNDGGISVGQAAIAAYPGAAGRRPVPSPS